MTENFVKADKVLEHLLARYGISKNYQIIYELWDVIVGKQIAKKIQVCGVKGDTILVTVATPAHHHYLKLYQKEWLKKINELCLQNEKIKMKFNSIKVVKL